MALIDRKFTYRRRIKVSANDLRLAKQGKKTCTIRIGTLGVEGSIVDLSDGHEALKVKIRSVETDKCFRDLGAEHARLEGFSSVEELRNDLQKYYGNIEAEQPITIITFDPIVA